jgi:hypothetical protein
MSLRRLRPDRQTSQLEHKIACLEGAAQTPRKTIHVHISETWQPAECPKIRF